MEVQTQPAIDKILLFRDEDLIKKHLQNANNVVGHLNNFIHTTETATRWDLTPAERIELKDNGYNFIKDKIKEISPFSNSSEDFNLTALGMEDVKAVYEMYQNKHNAWQSLNFELNDKNAFYLPPNEVLKIEDAYTYHTQNEAQIIALKTAETICKGLNDAINIKQVSESNFGNIVRITHLVTVGANKATGQREAQPNNRFIKTLN